MNLCLWIPLFHPYRPDTEVMWQVNMDSMSHIFSSFVNFLQLEDAYNIIVLNPRRNVSRANYGYRFAYLYSLLMILVHCNFMCVCRNEMDMLSRQTHLICPILLSISLSCFVSNCLVLESCLFLCFGILLKDKKYFTITRNVDPSSYSSIKGIVAGR